MQGSSEGLGDLERHYDDSIAEVAKGMIQAESLACLLGNKTGFCLKLLLFSCLTSAHILYRITTRNALACSLTVKEQEIALGMHNEIITMNQSLNRKKEAAFFGKKILTHVAQQRGNWNELLPCSGKDHCLSFAPQKEENIMSYRDNAWGQE